MAGACSTYGEIGSEYTIFSRNSEQKGYLRDLYADEG
jgi:hypothetical protein